jgi:hypothetical protein
LSARCASRGQSAAEDSLAFFGDDLVEQLLALGALSGVLRQEDLPNAVFLRARQGDFVLGRDGLQEFVRHLHENARPVTRVGLATARAAVIQLHQRANGVADDAVGFFAFDVGDEADAAGVVFELRVVETLGFGCG